MSGNGHFSFCSIEKNGRERGICQALLGAVVGSQPKKNRIENEEE